MIRNIKNEDIDKVSDIWLKTNIEVHDFIDENYWIKNYEVVKEMFKEANIFVYEENEEIKAFIGMVDDYIAGIFVSKDIRSCGIGKKLLDYVKEKHDTLYLNVYQKNINAIRFYQRNYFVIDKETIDNNTNEKEYLMLWHK